MDIGKGDKLQTLLQKSSRFIYKGEFDEIQEEEEQSQNGLSSWKDNNFKRKQSSTDDK